MAEHRLFPADTIGAGEVDMQASVGLSAATQEQTSWRHGSRRTDQTSQALALRYGVRADWDVGLRFDYVSDSVDRIDHEQPRPNSSTLLTGVEGRQNPTLSAGYALFGAEDAPFSLKAGLAVTPALRDRSATRIAASLTAGRDLGNGTRLWSAYSHSASRGEGVGSTRSLSAGIFKDISERSTLTLDASWSAYQGDLGTQGYASQGLGFGALIQLAPNTYFKPKISVTRNDAHQFGTIPTLADPRLARSLSLSAYQLLGAREGSSAYAAPGIALKELALRYWHSKGDSSWSHCASPACGGGTATIDGQNVPLADPTSRLAPGNLTGASLELFAAADLGIHWKASALLGWGAIRSGRLRDQDWADYTDLGGAPQTLVSDTLSNINGGRLNYYAADLGRRLPFDTIELVPFLGFARHSETFGSSGIIFLRDDIGLNASRADVPDSVTVGRHRITWSGLRIGLDATWDIAPGAQVGLNAAWLPAARGKIDDSHYLRRDLGPAPNVFDRAKGRGLMLDLLAKRRFSTGLLAGWDAELGFRYWKFKAHDGNVWSGPRFDYKFPLRSFETVRSGFFAGLGRRF